VGRRRRQATIKDVAQGLNLDWDTIKTLEKQYMRAQLARAELRSRRRADSQETYHYMPPGSYGA
jgi:hypothetical protein